MIRLHNCRRQKKQRSVIERLASKLWVPKLWLPMSPGYPCCCEEDCNCDECKTATPQEFIVVIDGIANIDPEECADCDDLNDTYTLQCILASDCEYLYTFPSVVCDDLTDIWLLLDYNDTFNECEMLCDIRRADTNFEFRWNEDKAVADGCDCANWIDETIAFLSTSSVDCEPVFGGGHPDPTCKVTAV